MVFFADIASRFAVGASVLDDDDPATTPSAPPPAGTIASASGRPARVLPSPTLPLIPAAFAAAAAAASTARPLSAAAFSVPARPSSFRECGAETTGRVGTSCGGGTLRALLRDGLPPLPPPPAPVLRSYLFPPLDLS